MAFRMLHCMAVGISWHLTLRLSSTTLLRRRRVRCTTVGSTVCSWSRSIGTESKFAVSIWKFIPFVYICICMSVLPKTEVAAVWEQHITVEIDMKAYFHAHICAFTYIYRKYLFLFFLFLHGGNVSHVA